MPSASASNSVAPRLLPPLAAVRMGGHIDAAAWDSVGRTVRLTRLDDQGKVIRSTTIMSDAEPVAGTDVQLAVFGSGLAMLWGGHWNKQPGPFLIPISDAGLAIGAPIAVGPAACITASLAFWADRQGAPGRQYHVLDASGGSAVGLAPVDEDATPGLHCAGDRAYSVATTEEGLTVRLLTKDRGHPPVLAMREEDFPEQERAPYEVVRDKSLMLLRVGADGGLFLRELQGTKPSPWTDLRWKLPDTDDVVSTSASGDTVLLVVSRDTREEDDAKCDAGAMSRRLYLLEVDSTKGRVNKRDIAPSVCGRERGPSLWILRTEEAKLAWAEPVLSPGTPGQYFGAIAGHKLADGSELATQKVRASAVALAGCDAKTCFVVALAPHPTDGASASPWHVLKIR